MSEGKKFDSEKLDWSTLHPDIVAPLVAVCAHGATKYEFENWKKDFGANYRRRFLAAIMRHYREAYKTPCAINQEDGGVYHLAQIAWDALTLLYHEIEKGGRTKGDLSDFDKQRHIDVLAKVQNFPVGGVSLSDDKY